MRRVALLTHNTSFGRAMAHEMHSHLTSCGHSLSAVTVFSRPSSHQAPKWPRIHRMVKTLKRRTSPKNSVLRLRHLEAKLDHQGRTYFEKHANPPGHWPDGIEICPTNEVKSDRFVRRLKDQNIDLLCVAGGPILKDDILDIPRLGAINMHSSILPAFRGTQAEFWQVHNDAYDKAGITIHRIDTGVDTGAILSQKSLNLTALESPHMIRAKNQLLALELLPQVAVDELGGTLKSIDQKPDETATTYRGKDRTIQARWQVINKLQQNGVLP